MNSIQQILGKLVVVLISISLAACLSAPSSSSTTSSGTTTTTTATSSYQTYYDECYVGTPALYSSTYCGGYATGRTWTYSASASNLKGAIAANSNVGNIGMGQTITSVGTPRSSYSCSGYGCSSLTSTTTTTTNTGTTTSTGGGVSCNYSYNTSSLSQCVTYSSSSNVTSCASIGSAVSSCSGTYRCVYSSVFTIYYSGTSVTASTVQSACNTAGGTFY